MAPSSHTGSAGGVCAHAAAWASSSAALRAAGLLSPCSSSQRGQVAVTMRRNSTVTAQWAANSGSAASGRRAARSISARSASSISAASSAASAQARSAVSGAPWAPPIARISRANAASRNDGSTAGGRSSAPASASGASSSAPSAVMRGSTSARPPETRRNASASARAARRVGSRISPRATASGSAVPARSSQAAATASRNGASGGRVNRFILSRRCDSRAARLPPRPDRPGWTDGTTARRAPRPSAARPQAPCPTPGSC